ncbi:MAG: DUF4249 family protein [Bacteroidetes bacterium]|nr:MAG: DUF4249 family protein [Bacteroidota bacterium]
MRKVWFVFGALLIGLSACLSPLDLNEVFQERVIIEGVILENQPARVRVSKSVSKTGENHFPLIGDARILLRTDNLEEQLAYQGNGIYESSNIMGEAGKTYSINVQVGKELYEASTTLPVQTVWMDSIGFKDALRFDSSGFVPQLDVFVFPKNEPSPNDFGFFSLEVDSLPYSQKNVFFQNPAPAQCPYFWSVQNIKKGTPLTVILYQTDQPVADYFKSLKGFTEQLTLVGFSVAPPENVPGNFDNDALGFFGAFQTDTLTRVLGN